MMKGWSIIALLLLAAPLGEAARVLGLKPFSMNRDSEVKAAPASSYPPNEDTITGKAELDLNGHLNRKMSVEQHHGSEANMNLNMSIKSTVSQQRSNRFLHKIVPSLKFGVVEPEMEKSDAPSQPLLGHSPGVGHHNSPGSRR